MYGTACNFSSHIGLVSVTAVDGGVEEAHNLLLSVICNPKIVTDSVSPPLYSTPSLTLGLVKSRSCQIKYEWGRRVRWRACDSTRVSVEFQAVLREGRNVPRRSRPPAHDRARPSSPQADWFSSRLHQLLLPACGFPEGV